MGSVISKTGIKRQKEYLYYIDKKGSVCKVKMARAGKKRGSPEVVLKAGIKKQKGYLYYVDKKGNVCAAKMVRGGRKKKK